MEYQVTVRYGSSRQRYHVFTLRAPGIAEALRDAAASLPEEVADHGTLVELREAVDPEGRAYLEELGERAEEIPSQGKREER